MMPIRYVASGGLSMRTLTPAFSYELSTVLERALEPVMPYAAMFVFMVIRRKG